MEEYKINLKRLRVRPRKCGKERLSNAANTRSTVGRQK